MAIASLHRTLSRTILTLGIVSLVACGGGGGGKKKDPAPDTTPNAYSYTATSNAEPSAVITSAPVTITGIDAATPVSVTGGEYSINGGAFTSVAGTITSGQTITIRLTAPAANSTSTSAQLTVGGVAATFTVTTKADTTPDAFAFAAQTNAAFNTEYTSTITVAGIDTAVPISITGGTYSIEGGAFTAAAGTVSVNNTVVVKGTSTSASESTHNVVLTIGGVSATYAITTVADTTPPVAEFKFPTPYTMSEANTVKVRGTATDDNAITNVKVVVRSFKLDTPADTLSTTEINATPKAEGDYSSWTVDVPLTALAENEIKVVATDDRENETQLAEANKVVIRQADVANAFPDEVNEFSRLIEFSALDGDRNRILVSDERKIIAVDVHTGKRTVFSEHQSVCNNIISGLTIDTQNSRLYGVCEEEVLLEFNLLDGALVGEYAISLNLGRNYGLSLDRFNGRNRLVLVEHAFKSRIISFDLDSKEFAVISPHDESLPIIDPFGGIALDGDSYWVTSGGQNSDAARHKIIKVNAITGKRDVFADNSTGSGELFSALLDDGETAYLSAIVKDTQNNRFIVMESISSKLISVDIDTGARSLFKDVSYNSMDSPVISYDMDLDETNGRFLVLDQLRRSVVMVDLETREKIIVSKSKNDY